MSDVLPVSITASLLLAASLLLSPGGAVNPLDDDAGSGGDAGDRAAVATPIEPGRFVGRLTAPHDAADWYRFDGRFGDYVTFEVTSDAATLVPFLMLWGPSGVDGVPGDLHTVGYGGHSMAFLLPEDGVSYLSVEVNQADLSETNYAIGFSVEHREGVQRITAPDPSFAFELHLEEPSDVWVWMGASPRETAVDEPTATTLLYDTALSTPASSMFEGSGGMRLWRSGTGDSWHVADHGVEGEMPVDLVAPAGRGSVSAVLDAEASTGFARFVAYFTGHTGEVELIFWTSGGATWGAGPAGPVTAFGTGDLHEEPDVLVPGVDPGGARSLQVPLQERTVGWAAGGGAALHATGPEGRVYESRGAPADFMPFYYPDHGEWSFAFAPPPQVADHADRIWFDYVQVPELEVAAEPWNPLPEG